MNKNFPYAPQDWSSQSAVKNADEESINLQEDHWEVIRSLQEYFSKNEHQINLRELNDALDERFNTKGGTRYLHTLFPKGPIVQGCKIAGLQLPPGAVDKSFGSSM